MKPLPIILIAALCTLNTYAKKFEIKWGPEYKKEGGHFAYDILLGSDENYFYALSNVGPKAKLQKFDFNCKLVEAVPLNIDLENGNTSISSFFTLSVKKFLLLTNRDKTTGIYSYYQADLNDWKLNGEKKNFYSMSISSEFSSLRFTRSPNREYIAGVGFRRGKYKEETVKVVLFDTDLKVLWEKDFNLGEVNRHLVIEQIVLDMEGSLYISAKHYENEEEYKKGLPKYSFSVYKLQENGKSETVLNLGDEKAPWDSGLFTADDKKLFVTGFYTKTTTSRGSADGVFIAILEDGKFKTNQYPFTEEFLEGLQTKKADKKDAGIYSFDVEYLLTLPNGDLTFIAEENFTTTSTQTINGSTSSFTIYHTNDIVMPRFNREGQLVSLDKVEKRYFSKDSETTSYSYLAKDNTIVLVFNDFKSKDPGKDSDEGGIFTNIAFIPGNGTVEMDNIFNIDDTKKFFIPYASLSLEGDRLVVRAMKRKSYMYGILTLH